MQFVTPEVFFIAETQARQAAVDAFLEAMGAKDWFTNAPSDAEFLIELAGKTCYKSFNLDLNKNLRRIREQRNKEYIGDGILKVKHGSVLEHPNVTMAYHNVSRIFTHEQVRHRIAGYSQESLRFVRLDELRTYFPRVFQAPFLKKVREALIADGKRPLPRGLDNPDFVEIQLRELFERIFTTLEQTQRELAELLQLDDLDSFGDKKKLTSAMRRLAPEGLATTIIATANLRTWRDVIEKRTDAAAEEEIRYVYGKVYEQLCTAYPNVFQDAVITFPDGMTQVKFQNSRV